MRVRIVGSETLRRLDTLVASEVFARLDVEAAAGTATAPPPVETAVETAAAPDAQNRAERGCTVARCGRGPDDGAGVWRISGWGTDMPSVSLVRCGRHYLGAIETLADNGYGTVLAERIAD